MQVMIDLSEKYVYDFFRFDHFVEEYKKKNMFNNTKTCKYWV